jgi:two-component system sensor histidine kinase/response regulator
VPARAAEADERDREACEALRAIPGMDLAQGLSSLLGRVPKLVTLLGRFAKERCDAADRIPELLGQGRRQDAIRAAHSIKGGAATLGLVGVAAAAARVEDDLAHERETDYSALRQSLAAACPELIRIAERWGG